MPRPRRRALLCVTLHAALALAPAPTRRRPVTRLQAATLGPPRVKASGYARKLAKDFGVDLHSVTGTGPGGRIVARDVEGAKGSNWVATPGATTATPKAQKLAKKEAVDLSTVAATGRFGRVTEDDVKRALGTLTEALGIQQGATIDVYPQLGSVPMTGMQQAIAANMEKTLDVPVFRVSKTIATDAFDDLYRKLKPEGVTVSALLAKAVAVSLKKHPLINAAYGSTGTIEYNDHINVAQAVALEGGLITPTLKDADSTSLIDLSANWKELVGKARSGSLAPDEYQSGTFTISNLGMMAVDKFAAILPPGQGAILAVASAKPQIVHLPKALTGMGIERRMMVTLTCDHRIISGADAALFLRDLQQAIESPGALAK
jgi:pyruvate dehydrogenase E2 component (dihydrolipoamide acetyltransferase)